MLPDHPEIARTLRTGYPYPIKSLFCAVCGKELINELYISNGDAVCGNCTRERILANYDTAALAAAFDIQQTTVEDYLLDQEEL